MASVSEQIASRINLGSIAKAEDLKKRIFDSDLNALMYPNSYVEVDEIPKLGTGKQDYKSAKRLALDWLGE